MSLRSDPDASLSPSVSKATVRGGEPQRPFRRARPFVWILAGLLSVNVKDMAEQANQSLARH